MFRINGLFEGFIPNCMRHDYWILLGPICVSLLVGPTGIGFRTHTMAQSSPPKTGAKAHIRPSRIPVPLAFGEESLPRSTLYEPSPPGYLLLSLALRQARRQAEREVQRRVKNAGGMTGAEAGAMAD